MQLLISITFLFANEITINECNIVVNIMFCWTWWFLCWRCPRTCLCFARFNCWFSSSKALYQHTLLMHH